MFRFSIYGQTKERRNKRLVAVSDFRDVAVFMRDHAAEMLDPSRELGLVFTMTENDAAAQFIPGRRNPDPSPEPESLTVTAAEEVKEYAGL